MPKIRAYTPAWLSAEFPDGHTLFSAPVSAAKASPFASSTASPRKKQPVPTAGPQRTIARRGTEVFIAIGKEIRWTDLVSTKSAWEATHDGQRSVMNITNGVSRSRPVYRILKPPVADDIRQLVVSPHNNYMAILTAHTVHICILPDPSHLAATDDTEVYLKTRYFTLGPTTHVTTRAPVVSALWHPLGVNGSAIVTVTRDAVVRLWEISPVDRWSFDSPALSIDVKKLADGTWLDQDFGASVNTNAGYSPDFFDMEVAAASFGPRSSGGWSSMTLWIAMVGGDVYALCPLLPKRWAPPPTLIPSLSVAIVANVAAVEDDADVSPRSKQLAQQQLDWMSQLDSQEPTVVESPTRSGYGPSADVFSRPAHPGIVPRLQGPFEVDFEDDDDEDEDDSGNAGELCDIFIIGEKVDTAFLMGVEDDGDDAAFQDLIDDADQEGLSLSVIGLVSTTGRLRICLDLVGVEAQWLPQRSHHSHKSSISGRAGAAHIPDTDNNSTSRPLLTFQIVDLVREAEKRPDGWCTFSPDVTSRYSFFVTHPGGITHISLSNWVFRLEQELHEGTDTGADFRVRQLVTGENTTRHRVYVHKPDETLATSIVMRDPDLGYFLLSATDHSPVGISFDSPEGNDELGSSMFRSSFRSPDQSPTRPAATEQAEDKAVLALDFWKARPAFEIPRELLMASQFSQAKNMLFTSRYQMLQHQEVRLSPATLNIFTNAHKLVGKESGLLNQAVSQVFTKLQDLPIDLHEQIQSAATLKHRIDMIAGNDLDDDEQMAGPLTDDVRLRQRLKTAQDRHDELSERLERLRRTFNMASARPLSDKERMWSKEVQTLDASLQDLSSASTLPSAGVSVGSSPTKSTAAAGDVGLRVQQIHSLWEELAKQAGSMLLKASIDEKAAGAGNGELTSRPGSPSSLSASTSSMPAGSSTAHMKVPADVRKAKMAQVTKLLERESAMVDAVTERLERLGMAS
ncbi:hypothetical protein CMQ_2879 [Grosmannia clavigera kw1407]|uniref:Nuclear pore complex protein an-nup82 n=1 Tax=Grosmannia clavigera (strain kw1407 / UAMH 11150) TaxID=655863 RepID=F0XGY0_GROCL|nr:uncharacterized protein CMQ_2879 [Grosmannia clavigera kw1407]EFX02950.1 hypothetical protein CMQ_2879 [Grosmannia clavigera kw1407]